MIVRITITAKIATKEGGIKHHKVQVVYKHVRHARALELKKQHPFAQVLRGRSLDIAFV